MAPQMHQRHPVPDLYPHAKDASTKYYRLSTRQMQSAV